MRRFYAPAESFDGSEVSLDVDETRHLRNVLRLQVGDEASVFDGLGNEFRCTIAEIAKKSARLTVMEQSVPAAPESPLELTLASTVLNGEKYDLIVQKAVELGVRALVPLVTVRCDVKQNDAVKRVGRWKRIAMEATKQSGRATIMKVAEPAAFDSLISKTDPQQAVLFSERDGENFSTLKSPKTLTVFIGPKGGWDDTELDAARDQKIPVITMGGRILRAETAAIAMTAILQHRFGDLN
jgi:16S rRNA (uracil1498-N3)-methyltransferase